jgi:hypothetical protein
MPPTTLTWDEDENKGGSRGSWGHKVHGFIGSWVQGSRFRGSLVRVQRVRTIENVMNP